MAITRIHETVEPTRSAIDALPGPVVVEFGAPWCGHCLSAQPLLETAFAAFPQVRNIKIEDGRGRPLGRTFRVKLWPTLVFLRDGEEVARLVRPTDADAIVRGLALITATDPARSHQSKR